MVETLSIYYHELMKSDCIWNWVKLMQILHFQTYMYQITLFIYSVFPFKTGLWQLILNFHKFHLDYAGPHKTWCGSFIQAIVFNTHAERKTKLTSIAKRSKYLNTRTSHHNLGGKIFWPIKTVFWFDPKSKFHQTHGQ